MDLWKKANLILFIANCIAAAYSHNWHAVIGWLLCSLYCAETLLNTNNKPLQRPCRGRDAEL